MRCPLRQRGGRGGHQAVSCAAQALQRVHRVGGNRRHRRGGPHHAVPAVRGVEQRLGAGRAGLQDTQRARRLPLHSINEQPLLHGVRQVIVMSLTLCSLEVKHNALLNLYSGTRRQRLTAANNELTIWTVGVNHQTNHTRLYHTNSNQTVCKQPLSASY